MKVKDWQIVRCVYDRMGMLCNEIEDPDRFARKASEGATTSYFIGKKGVYKGQPFVKVILEGDKKVLEYVLDANSQIKAIKRRAEAAESDWQLAEVEIKRLEAILENMARALDIQTMHKAWHEMSSQKQEEIILATIKTLKCTRGSG